ncbi:MAG: type II toxin-antitoxin system PemK/MazF family toxin [Thermoleophilia bacterium]
MTRGSVVLVALPRPNPATSSHVQAGPRPAVIVQADDMRNPGAVILVVPMTTNMDAIRFSGSLLVTPDSVNGLTSPSVLLLTQLRAIDCTLIVRTLGRLGRSDMGALDEQLGLILGLPMPAH